MINNFHNLGKKHQNVGTNWWKSLFEYQGSVAVTTLWLFFPNLSICWLYFWRTYKGFLTSTHKRACVQTHIIVTPSVLKRSTSKETKIIARKLPLFVLLNNCSTMKHQFKNIGKNLFLNILLIEIVLFFNLLLSLGRTVSLAPTIACPGSMLLQIPVIVLYLRTLSGEFRSFKLLIWLLQKFLPLDTSVTQSLKVSPKLVVWPKLELAIDKKYLDHLKLFKETD